MTDIREHCNLSNEDLEARWREVREKLIPRACGREALSDGLALFFDATSALNAELDAFVDFERECCPGLGWSVRDGAEGLRPEIRGVDPAAAIFAGIGQPTAPDNPTSPGSDKPVGCGWKPVLRGAGFGAVGALVLFCVVPIGAPVVGATIFRGIDNLWAIGSSAVVFGGLPGSGHTGGTWHARSLRPAATAAVTEGRSTHLTRRSDSP